LTTLVLAADWRKLSSEEEYENRGQHGHMAATEQSAIDRECERYRISIVRFIKPLYGLTPVPRVRIPPSPPYFLPDLFDASRR
jgi:hypothetical protein